MKSKNIFSTNKIQGGNIQTFKTVKAYIFIYKRICAIEKILFELIIESSYF